MAGKPQKKTVHINDLFVDLDLNIRQRDNYDLATLAEQVRDMGRIIKPMIVKWDETRKKFVVLQGNRRTLVGQQLFEDKTSSQELVENLKKVDVIVYNDLTPTEELAMIMDHSGEKAISRTEVVISAWRLSKSFLSEGEIAKMMYYPLAKFTGNEKKLLEVPTEPSARAAFLKKWFHGTLGNFILAAAGMGDEVREQFILTHRKEDNLITKEEEANLVMKCKRDRITQLSAAITADTKGSGWTTPEYVLKDGVRTLVGGGEAFNGLIEKFKTEDAGGVTEKSTRPSVKVLQESARVYKNEAIKATLAIAAGENVAENGKKLLELDAALTLTTYKLEIIHSKLSKVKDPAVLALLAAIVDGNKPAGEVEVTLLPFIS